MGPTQERRDDASQAGPTIEWRDAFRIGVDQIDEEHRHLFSLVKSLHSLSIQDTLNELLDYVVIHFGHEEELMASIGFPEYRQQLDMHEEFTCHLAEWLSSSPDWPQERVEELRNYLNRWLSTHILGADLRIGQWLWTSGRNIPPAAPRPTLEKHGWFHRLLGRSPNRPVATDS
jgi:hemerythrin